MNIAAADALMGIFGYRREFELICPRCGQPQKDSMPTTGICPGCGHEMSLQAWAEEEINQYNDWRKKWQA